MGHHWLIFALNSQQVQRKAKLKFMYFVKFANISNSKIRAKGREEGSATHKWMLLGKGNIYEGILTIVEKPKNILV